MLASLGYPTNPRSANDLGTDACLPHDKRVRLGVNLLYIAQDLTIFCGVLYIIDP